MVTQWPRKLQQIGLTLIGCLAEAWPRASRLERVAYTGPRRQAEAAPDRDNRRVWTRGTRPPENACYLTTVGVLGALVAGHSHCHSLRQLCGKITGQSQIARGLIIPYVWQAVLDSLRDSVRIDRLSRQRLSSC